MNFSEAVFLIKPRKKNNIKYDTSDPAAQE